MRREGRGERVEQEIPALVLHSPLSPLPSPLRGKRQGGFTLAGLFVVMAVMAIFLTVAVQSASFQAQREKEEELIFRGQQAVEAIRLFRARNGRFPLTLEELQKAKPRVLRKPWADPMTGVPDWVPIYLGEQGTTLAGGQPAPTPTPARGGSRQPAGARGPIIGVRSRVCADSIKVYEGRTKYCEWKFFFDAQKPAQPGQPKPPVPGPTPRPPRDD
ncbi:MAG: type secretion system protein [Acidobacteria bacterium]|nr:type secretion system protein [Acidobacteriota bacterium]